MDNMLVRIDLADFLYTVVRTENDAFRLVIGVVLAADVVAFPINVDDDGNVVRRRQKPGDNLAFKEDVGI